jgi:hypothetical protein
VFSKTNLISHKFFILLVHLYLRCQSEASEHLILAVAQSLVSQPHVFIPQVFSQHTEISNSVIFLNWKFEASCYLRDLTFRIMFFVYFIFFFVCVCSLFCLSSLLVRCWQSSLVKHVNKWIKLLSINWRVSWFLDVPVIINFFFQFEFVPFTLTFFCFQAFGLHWCRWRLVLPQS